MYKLISSKWYIWVVFFFFCILILWIFFGRRYDQTITSLDFFKSGEEKEDVEPKEEEEENQEDNEEKEDVEPKEEEKSSTFSSPFIEDIQKISEEEKECLTIFQTLFDRDFSRQNINTGDYNLKVTGYNKDIRLAVDYRTPHHYIQSWHKTKEDFERMIKIDEIKDRICKKRGIYLMHVPYTVEIQDIREYIIRKLPHQYRNLCGINSY